MFFFFVLIKKLNQMKIRVVGKKKNNRKNIALVNHTRDRSPIILLNGIIIID